MKWDLTYLFANDEEFLKALEGVSTFTKEFKEFNGKLGEKENLIKFLKLQKDFEEYIGRVYQYASLKSDLNKKDVNALANLNKVMAAFQNYGIAVSFAEPEILVLGKDYVMSVIESDSELQEFKFIYERLFHQNEHILSNKEELLLSINSPLHGAGSELYSSLLVGDATPLDVELTNGEHVKVSSNNYTGLLSTLNNEEDRRRVFMALFGTYEAHKNTMATIYKAVLDSDKATAMARHYSSSLEAHLFGNNIPVEVYHNLVEVAGSSSKTIRRYYDILEKQCGLTKYHTYDRMLNLGSSDTKYNYEDSKELFFNSIKDFPEDFKEKAKEVLRDGFVDVYPSEGKRSGAYSSGMANMHPFILLNHDDTLDAAFTLAHESGHSIHSLYSCEAQPTMLQDYTIFVAEIASTFNEHNLLDYFLRSPNATKNEKIMVIQKAIDNIIGTFFRQTLFAEYELIAHELNEKDENIDYTVLSDIMVKLYKKYYDLDIEEEVLTKYVWCYIPHLFYTPYYVYQYATSFAASFKLYQDVKDNVPGAFDRYIGLLKSGGSKYPMDEVKEAGVDFTKKDAFMAVINRFNELVDELEKLINE